MKDTENPMDLNNKPEFSKATIYFFSGTGNSRHVAYWIGDEFKRSGIETNILSIADLRGKPIFPPEKNTIVGFCSPTHGFHFPEITRKFIHRFPGANESKAFVVNTRAGLRIGKLFIPGLSGLTLYASAYRLFLKGYPIIGLRPVDLPSNWLSLHPAVRAKGIAMMYQHQEIKVRAFAQKIAGNKKDFRAIFDLIQDLLITPVAIGYMVFGRYALAKSFIASHKCSDCGLCMKSCPVKAIKKVQGRMFWTYRCESCMLCMNQCPEKAIETAHGFFIGFFYLFMTFVFDFLLGQLQELYPGFSLSWMQNPMIRFTVGSALALPFLFGCYRIMHWLLQYRIFERLFVWTSLTSFRFWGRYTKGIKG